MFNLCPLCYNETVAVYEDKGRLLCPTCFFAENDPEGKWVTIKGRPVLIKDGEPQWGGEGSSNKTEAFLSDKEGRKQFKTTLTNERIKKFGLEHERKMGMFFGIDWIGQDQSGSILKLNDMVAKEYGYTVSNKDTMDVFSKMRPGINPMLGLFTKNNAFINMTQDGKLVDMSDEYFNMLKKEKEYSKEMFEAKFGKEAEVYKGVLGKYSSTVKGIKSGNIKVKDMPLSSYTIDKNVAKKFAGSGGFILKRKVSSNDVWFGVHSVPDFSEKYGDYEFGEGEVVVGNKSLYTKFKPEDVEQV